jgi:heme/copper-type cytochrome/quinol oxidase subunit 2
MIFVRALPVLLLATGCDQVSSELDSAGPQAERIEGLWWLFFWICLAVYIAVLIWLGYALLHRRSAETEGPTAHPSERSERRARQGLAV